MTKFCDHRLVLCSFLVNIGNGVPIFTRGSGGMGRLPFFSERAGHRMSPQPPIQGRTNTSSPSRLNRPFHSHRESVLKCRFDAMFDAGFLLLPWLITITTIRGGPDRGYHLPRPYFPNLSFFLCNCDGTVIASIVIIIIVIVGEGPVVGLQSRLRSFEQAIV